MVQNGFYLITPEKTYTLSTKSSEEKNDWISDINDAIARFLSSSLSVDPNGVLP